ncbi:sugar ABC transporter ATP-binding protein [Oceanobacillus oncorhynchi]|uniref:sugar ABC transporter ATP-binding protein n=1 Tax=Oceanobacillus oncorhynchi TaxID=545501 RepID=UPI002F966304
MDNNILEMKDIEKSFGVVKALKKVNLELSKGEVHALMGENGAGKSTLVKVLTGIHQKDSGQIIYDGNEVEYKKPKESQDAGISVVHQELNMMNHLTIAQNIFIGRESVKAKFFTDDHVINKKTKALFKMFNMEVDPKEKVGNLTVGKQQMVEIIKAVSMDAKIVIFDEPTASLTEKEIDELFKIIENLKSKGIAIVYISHRMDEIFKITDRITIMRDGEYVGSVDTKETTKDQLINMMVGRVVYEDPKQESEVDENANIVLSVKNLHSKDVKDVSFDLRKGEILGFSGLMGAGRTEVMRLIFGADPKDKGEIYINGKKTPISKPQDAVDNGIGYLSEDRKQFGIVTGMSVSDNVVQSSLKNYVKNMIIDDKRIREVSEKYVTDLKIKTSSTKQLLRNLSGGNQQKVVIAKWLEHNSDILIFDEPTRGIDVGAKSEIYSLMNELVKLGKSIIMISSELTEILRMSDRIIVMCEGRKVKELSIEEATQEKILHYATARKEGDIVGG